MAVGFPLHYSDAITIIITGVVVAIAFRRRSSRVLSGITQKVRLAAEGDLDTRVNMRPAGAVGDLTEALDTLLARRTADVLELKGVNEVLERKAADDRRITKLGLDIVSSKDMVAVVEKSVSALMGLTGAGACLLYRLEGETAAVVSDVRDITKKGREQLMFRSGNGLVGAVVADGVPVLTNNLQYDERYAGEYDGLFIFPVRSTLIVPIKIGCVVCGAVQLVNKPDMFAPDDLDRVERLCKYIAVAISNVAQTGRMAGTEAGAL